MANDKSNDVNVVEQGNGDIILTPTQSASLSPPPIENEFYATNGVKGGYLMLWISKLLLQRAADKFLTIDDDDKHSDSSGPASWGWSWWMKLRNKGLTFVDSRKIRIGLDLKAGGSAHASISTHCGPVSFGTELKSELIPTPTALDLGSGPIELRRAI